MSTNRNAAIALISGSAAGLVVMATHPMGHEVIDNATAGESNLAVIAVHALAIFAQPFVLAGTLALTTTLRARRDLAVAAFVFFAFASIAVMIAAVASGFLAPGVLRGLGEADEARRTMMMSALHYTGLVNQVFAKIHVTFSGVAILLWSFAILSGREMSRALGIYGVTLGVVLILGVGSGHLHLGVHGFGLVLIGEGVWLTWAAVQLWRDTPRSAISV